MNRLASVLDFALNFFSCAVGAMVLAWLNDTKPSQALPLCLGVVALWNSIWLEYHLKAKMRTFVGAAVKCPEGGGGA